MTIDLNNTGPKKMRVADHFDEVDEFEDLISECETQASRDKDMNFVADMREKFDMYGADTFLSEAQLDWLNRIAER